MEKENKALWGGAFDKGTDKNILQFNSAENIKLDEKLIIYDIVGSLAHVKMLEEQEILKKEEAEEISKALVKIKADYDSGKSKLDPALEDVHMNIEAASTKITDHAKKMHTARSRNDQVLLDMRLYMRDECLNAIKSLSNLQKSFISLSKHDGLSVGYTHTRVAQPITVSFWCDSFVKSFNRDIERLEDCYKRINQNPLGVGAVAGTGFNIDRSKTAKLLAFGSVQENAFDTINSRGECEAEFAFCLSSIMMKLSRLCEELLWLSQKGLIVVPEEFTTGSSMMPNKKNADVLELVRGRSARVYSNLFHILTAMKNLMSGYNSDMQETKYAIMQAIETTGQCLAVMAEIVPKLQFNQKKIAEELENGYAQATELADFLAMQGMPFREAHEIVGKTVKYCQKNGKTMSQLSPEELKNLTGKGFSAVEIKTLLGLERPRLKIKINDLEIQQHQRFAVAEKEKIREVFDKLLQM